MCPLVTAKFHRMAQLLDGTPIRLLETALDPEYDTPAVLRRYGAAMGADGRRWTLATSEPAARSRPRPDRRVALKPARTAGAARVRRACDPVRRRRGSRDHPGRNAGDLSHRGWRPGLVRMADAAPPARRGVASSSYLHKSVVDGIVPPSSGQRIDPTRVAQTPPFDHPGLRKIAAGSYEAYYVAHVFAFAPDTITIPRGSRVTFYVTSPDVVHGFSTPLIHSVEDRGDSMSATTTASDFTLPSMKRNVLGREPRLARSHLRRYLGACRRCSVSACSKFSRVRTGSSCRHGWITTEH
jgi:hypothetical protein